MLENIQKYNQGGFIFTFTFHNGIYLGIILI